MKQGLPSIRIVFLRSLRSLLFQSFFPILRQIKQHDLGIGCGLNLQL